MVRLQRVTFTALHQYLGLSAELVNQGTHKKKQSSFSGSPVRSRTRENFAAHNADTMPSTVNLATTLDPYDGSDGSAQKEATGSNTSQPIPIIVNRRYITQGYISYAYTYRKSYKSHSFVT